MSSTLARFTCDPARTAAPAEILLPELLAALDGLVGSAEPGVVFTSLVRLCVPLCCDSCTISIIESDGAAYQLRWPHADAELDGPAGIERAEPERGPVPRLDPARDQALDQVPGSYQLTEHAVLVPFADAAGGYRGSMTWTFRRHRPTGTEALLAQLVLERAVGVVWREQLEASAASSAALAANLQVALASSREIGMAMGIVMERHKLSSDQAFDLLTRISQRSHRRVRELAREIAETGVIDLPAGLTLTPPPRPAPKAGLLQGIA
jgi:hypothetical protein